MIINIFGLRDVNKMLTIKSTRGIYHQAVIHDGRHYYLCNRAVGPHGEVKLTKNSITCKNCMSKISLKTSPPLKPSLPLKSIPFSEPSLEPRPINKIRDMKLELRPINKIHDMQNEGKQKGELILNLTITAIVMIILYFTLLMIFTIYMILTTI